MTSDVFIRVAAPEDAAGVVALNGRLAADAAYFLAYDIDPVSGAEILQAKLGGSVGGDGVLVAVTDADDIVGMAMLRRHRHPAFEGVLQLGLGVDPDARRLGVGAQLAAASVAHAEAAGARRIQAAIVAENRAAIALFARAGFQEEGRLRGAARIDGIAHDVLAMARAL